MDNFFQTLVRQIELIRITDLLDIAIITILIYKVLQFIRDTKTFSLLKGIGVIVVVTQLSQLLKLYTVNYLLSGAMQMGMIALIVVFQPELRRVIGQLGQTPIGKWFKIIFKIQNDEEKIAEEKVRVILEIRKSCMNMSAKRIGALIVMERSVIIDDAVGGTVLNAEVSEQLLDNIFIPNTPLHDGAVIIRNNKIESASCFLTLSKNSSVNQELGTRHRAGLGVTEETDAVAIIVSEETGNISIACGGELNMALTPDEMQAMLFDLFEVGKPSAKPEKVSFFPRKERNK